MTPQASEQLLADVDAYCQELRPTEELCYLDDRFNDQTIELAKKYKLLGMPIPVEYGGRGANSLTYARAICDQTVAKEPASAPFSRVRPRSGNIRSCVMAMPINIVATSLPRRAAT